MRLDLFDNRSFDRGRPRWLEAMWMAVQAFSIASWLPGSGWRIALLRGFGAQIGHGVVIKPGVRVKFPWRLTVGDHSWIGESAWIDCLAQVSIGSHCCISQGSYLCTGNHDWSDPRFGLKAQPITIGDRVWVGAHSKIAPGAILQAGSVLTLGSVAIGTLTQDTIYTGIPAKPIRKRSGRPVQIAP